MTSLGFINLRPSSIERTAYNGSIIEHGGDSYPATAVIIGGGNLGEMLAYLPIVGTNIRLGPWSGEHPTGKVGRPLQEHFANEFLTDQQIP
jgi:hypothetical protein